VELNMVVSQTNSFPAKVSARDCRSASKLDLPAEPSQQSAREAAKTLSGRNAVIAMVPIFGELTLDAVLPYRTPCFSDVVMRTNKDQPVGVVEEKANGLDFRRGSRLASAERIETDYYNAIDAVEHGIERRRCTLIAGAFDLNDLMTR
jgi:hypothetical protein